MQICSPIHICTKQRAKISSLFKPMFPLSTLPPPGSPTFCAVFSPRPSIPSSVSLSSEFSSLGKGSRLALHRRGRAQTHSSKGPPGVSSKQGKLPSFTLGICATCLKWINSLKVCPQHNSIQYAHQICSSLVFMSKHPQGIFSLNPIWNLQVLPFVAALRHW